LAGSHAGCGGNEALRSHYRAGKVNLQLKIVIRSPFRFPDIARALPWHLPA